MIAPTDAIETCKSLRTLLSARTPPVRLVAVSKGQGPEKIRALYEDGQREFGENYLEELEEKAASLRDLEDLRWIFIGTVQSNKIQRIMRIAAEIQTITSEKHARYVDRYAKELGLTSYPVFIEVNCDENKTGGIHLNGVNTLAATIQRDFPAVHLLGLMAVPPIQYSDQACGNHIPDLYRRLAAIANTTGDGGLSLGMTSDRQIALMAGSTCLRIGRALFGERQYSATSNPEQ